MCGVGPWEWPGYSAWGWPLIPPGPVTWWGEAPSLPMPNPLLGPKGCLFLAPLRASGGLGGAQAGQEQMGEDKSWELRGL